jgi:hypothetical protein
MSHIVYESCKHEFEMMDRRYWDGKLCYFIMFCPKCGKIGHYGIDF